MAKTLAVLIPVLGRPHRVKPVLESLYASTDKAEAYFIANIEDKDEVQAIIEAKANLIICKDISWAKKINYGFTKTEEPWLLLGADDLNFRKGWTDVIDNELKTFSGVIGTNDLGNVNTRRGVFSTHPIVHRQYVIDYGTFDEKGKVVHDGYRHNFPDTELCETAKTRQKYLHMHQCYVEHLHPAWGKSSQDATYDLGLKSVLPDMMLYKSRMIKLRSM